MDEAGSASNNNETIPDLKDIEVKIGRKTPEGLLKCMREEVSSQRGGDAKLSPPVVVVVHEAKDMTGKKSLDEKIRKLKLEMAHLRSVDVKILQQLLAVHEGIEAVKWLMEERSTLTSRCSSLTSSQYSLGEGPDTSWRGSWSSLHDNDKLDNVSIGSYLDTLADDMDEYCPSSSESVICSTAPPASEAAGPGRTGGGGGGDAVAGAAGVGAGSGSGPKSGTEGPPGASEVGEGAQLGPGTAVGSGMEVKAGPGTAGSISAVASRAAAPGKSAAPGSSPQKSEGSKQEAPVWTKATEREKGLTVNKDNGLSQAVKTNGVPEKATKQIGGGSDTARPRLNDKLGKKQSPKLKSYKNGKIDLESCKRNGKMHLEYDAHWRWVQSQEDVTFL